MYISSNILKKYIENSDKINWLDMWNNFTIHSAEIDGIEEKGKDIDSVVVAEVTSLEMHPSNEKYMVAKLAVSSSKIINVVTSAKNLYVGMKVPCALEGGSLKGLSKVTVAELGNVKSEGVLASEKELGISDKHEGIMELNKSWTVGENIKKYIPIDDIVIEIDNKSLTNRPDMWGHYGIAREVAAITGTKLLPLEVEPETNFGKEKIDIVIEDKVNCNRYSAVKINNINEKKSDVWMQTMLYYCGMRSISLLVDLTNYLMLELGQPMHAFDSKKIDNIVVRNIGKEKVKFTTLDGVERVLAENTLMICDDKTPVAIAGIMGGMNSEIEDDTTSLILESANFDATCVRKSATAMGLRTEASARYEKSLDPNMTDLAIKRFVKLLKDVDSSIRIDSRLEDVYSNKVEGNKVVLKKDYLKKYMGFVLGDSKVVEILTSLDFKVDVRENEYEIVAPTYRSTKDISNSADVIEEIARIYGYNNLQAVPLKLDLIIPEADGKYELEYSLKKNIALNLGYSEVHTYLWYQTEMLNKYGIDKCGNVRIVNKKDNQYIRDDLSLSLFEKCLENSKYFTEYGIFEIGSVMTREKENRVLSILSVCLNNNLEVTYNRLKKEIYNMLTMMKNEKAEFAVAEKSKEYLNHEYTLDILVKSKKVGYISIFENTLSRDLSKKVSVVNAEINVDYIMDIKKNEIKFEEPSKYPITTLDITVIIDKEDTYAKLDNVLKKYYNEYLLGYNLVDQYIDEKKKLTIRFTVASKQKTLTREEITEVHENLMDYIEKNGYEIVK